MMELISEWHQISCLHCKALFAMPMATIRRYEESHEGFNCPYCQGNMHYPQETKEEILKRKLEEKARLLDQERQCCITAREEANTLERKVWGMKGYATKLKKKLAQG